MPKSPSHRCVAIALIAAALVMLAPALADAKAGFGSSMGSRGARTYSAPPPTMTAPKPVAPIQRSITPTPQSGAPQTLGSGGGWFRGGGFMSGLFGGLIGAGIGGLLFGHGFFGGIGGFGSIIGLLLQFGLIYLLVRWAIGFFRRSAMQISGGAAAPGAYGGYAATPRTLRAPGGGMGSSPAAAIGQGDYNEFERLLGAIQAAWSQADLAALRRHVTPEMLSYFGEQLSAQASRGFQNHVEQVRLLQGDLSEAWSEDGIDYATVAMRYGLVDWTVELGTGRVVDGDPTHAVETTEVWTFMRAKGGHWLLSAIQQT